MGISFKVSKIGRKFRPKLPPSPAPVAASVRESDKNTNENSSSLVRTLSKPQVVVAQAEAGGVGFSVGSENGGKHVSPEHEISFALNLFRDGFSIVKPSEIVKIQAPLEDMSKCSHPYNRMSQRLLSAIESGRLPVDILDDDIPSKYYNGTIICEVRDYRKCVPEGTNGSSKEGIPIISNVLLRMSLENIVEDIPTISDDSWTYSDLLEVEARVLKALQPQLCLDPTPMLDRLCSDTMINKLNLALSSGKRKRLPQMELTSSINNQILGKKICLGKVPENMCNGSGDLKATSCDLAGQHPRQSTTVQQSPCGPQAPILVRERSLPSLPPSSQPSIAYPGINQDRFPLGTNNFTVINTQVPSSQTIMRSYSDKKDNQDTQQTNLSNVKRPKQTPVGLEVNQHLMGVQVEAPAGADMHWKNTTLSQKMDGKGTQYSASISGQKYFSPMVGDISSSDAGNSFYPNQQGLNISIKQEQNEIEKLDKQEPDKLKSALQISETECGSLDHQRLRAQQLSPQSFMKPQISSQQPWHNIPSAVEKDPRKDDILSKRRVPQNPCVSAAASIPPPISTKSDLPTVPLNGHFGVVTAASPFASQKEKAPSATNATLGSASATSSHSDSIQRQPQKRKASSMSKSHPMSGVGSPASVSNTSVSLNASSPSLSSLSSLSVASLPDSFTMDRLSKIDMITQRYQINVKKKKVESFNVRKPSTYSKMEIARSLSNLNIVEDVRDSEKSMSRSIIGGTMNNCKTRILTYAQPNMIPGMSRNRFRIIMNEKLLDGNVIMQYGDLEESDISHDCMIELSSTHHADLVAAQHKSLMERDGYQVVDDQTVAHTNIGSGNSSSAPNMPLDSPAPDVQQPEGVSGQQSSVVLVNNNNDTNHLSTPQNPPNNMRMLPPGNTHVLPMSQGYLPSGPTATVSMRPQQMEQALLQQQQSQQQLQQHQMQSPLQGQSQQTQIQGQSQQQQQQQLQHAQIQRSSSMLQMSPLSQLIGQNSTMQLGGNPMINKTQLHLQALQQQAQQQQFPRKGMMGLGAMGMGNSMMGLGALNNVMGGARGISSPLAQVQGLSGIGANQINLSSANSFGAGLRSSLPQAALKYRMQQQSRMYGAQPGISSLPGNGNNQMISSSMGMTLLGRPNMGPLPRTAIASMGPPKMSGTNIYMNHQLQLQQQQLHQQLQQQQQLQPSQQPQQVCSPMQQSQVGSPSTIGSPPAVATQQQQISPQQLSQQIAMSPQQLSGGTLQQINNAGTAGPGPASPQLSSQTHNSVGSISSSPMELQATNKAGSVNTG